MSCRSIGPLHSLFVVVAALLWPAASAAFSNFELYLAPSVGYAWLSFKSIEIDEGFLKPRNPSSPDGEPQPTKFEADDVRRPVGEKSVYDGKGPSLGVSAGLKLFAVSLGFHYDYMSFEIDGYSRRYRYDPYAMQARGRKFKDNAQIDLHRAMAEIYYGLPIGKVELAPRTRIGAVFLDPNGLEMGRAIQGKNGMVADLGIALGVAVSSFLELKIDGWYGIFFFNGSYDGAFGGVGGLNLILNLKI